VLGLAVHQLEGRRAQQALRAVVQRHPAPAAGLLLGIECCTALLASRGGRGMSLDDSAQRLLRAAAFQLVHSQAEHIRAATLQALTC
jgi:hypothetical protein